MSQEDTEEFLQKQALLLVRRLKAARDRLPLAPTRAAVKSEPVSEAEEEEVVEAISPVPQSQAKASTTKKRRRQKGKPSDYEANYDSPLQMDEAPAVKSEPVSDTEAEAEAEAISPVPPPQAKASTTKKRRREKEKPSSKRCDAKDDSPLRKDEDSKENKKSQLRRVRRYRRLLAGAREELEASQALIDQQRLQLRRREAANELLQQKVDELEAANKSLKDDARTWETVNRTQAEQVLRLEKEAMAAAQRLDEIQAQTLRVIAENTEVRQRLRAKLEQKTAELEAVTAEWKAERVQADRRAQRLVLQQQALQAAVGIPARSFCVDSYAIPHPSSRAAASRCRSAAR
eukprot:EG_transcript_11954